jgi:hypothetical protein
VGKEQVLLGNFTWMVVVFPTVRGIPPSDVLFMHWTVTRWFRAILSSKTTCSLGPTNIVRPYSVSTSLLFRPGLGFSLNVFPRWLDMRVNRLRACKWASTTPGRCCWRYWLAYLPTPGSVNGLTNGFLNGRKSVASEATAKNAFSGQADTILCKGLHFHGWLRIYPSFAKQFKICNLLWSGCNTSGESICLFDF